MSDQHQGPGQRLRAALAAGVVHAPGVQDGVSARLAVEAGAEVLYVSGAATSAVSLGLPDLGFVNGGDISELAGRIAGMTRRPVVADADTGYGNAVHAARTVRQYRAAGIAGLHLEDQVQPKRCGHMAGKAIVPMDEATARVRAAVEAAEGDVVVIARTDAWGVAGADEALARAQAFAEAGADLVFVEGPRRAEDLEKVAAAGLGAPLVLNRSEAGAEAEALDDGRLRALGVGLVIHPVSGLLAAAAALATTYREIVERGSTDTPRMGWSEFNRVLGLDQVLADEERWARAAGSDTDDHTREALG